MNIDQAVAEWKRIRETYDASKYSPTLNDIFVAEIERLQRSNQGHEDQLVRIAQVLGKDARQAPEHDKTIAGAVIAEVERLRAELAAAKVASVCPVKFDGVYANSADEAVVWFEEAGKAEQFADWLREMKEQTPPAE